MDRRDSWFVKSKHAVVLDRGNYTSCTVNLLGATVTSWRINDKEMLFLSRESHFTGLSHIAGGIQFAFPILGDWEFGPKNGFARKTLWKLVGGPEKLHSGDVCATFSLMYNPYTLSFWNFKFELFYKVTLYEKKIDFQITVVNWDTYPMEFVIVQRCLWRVNDVTKCKIKGLKNCKYKDFLRNGLTFQEEREDVMVTEKLDRVYSRTPNKLVLKNTVDGGSLNLLRRNSRDVLLWNPWIGDSLKGMDLGNSCYLTILVSR
ncbi:hypothetical protein NQ315_003041 [Exocentrus adspersus]|uniref:Galactose mutarotase n=1 Tax=Exocentrus adspersus TaxID=1586481 RepID=A0AAV8W4R4_9CUCU|nr:hypothetical protein NQ315_003041 [Exocentrus adspersus]